MGFKVVKDYLIIKQRKEGISEDLLEEVTKETPDYKGGKIAVKVYDDDGTLYYEARCDTEECAERFHDWSSWDSGTTFSKIRMPGERKFGNFIG